MIDSCPSSVLLMFRVAVLFLSFIVFGNANMRQITTKIWLFNLLCKQLYCKGFCNTIGQRVDLWGRGLKASSIIPIFLVTLLSQ
jgi:hypothetical protein